MQASLEGGLSSLDTSLGRTSCIIDIITEVGMLVLLTLDKKSVLMTAGLYNRCIVSEHKED